LRNGRQNGVVPERVLTPAHLNRALLARQRFLERGDLTIPGALEAIGGIQTSTRRPGTSACGPASARSGGRR